MDKKVVVITGAGSGLGASLAKKYADRDYHVVLIGRTKQRLQNTAEQLKSEYTIYKLDVSSRVEVANVFQNIKEKFGHIDLLINNAGTGIFELAENIHADAVHKMIDINLKGTIFCTQEVLPDMKKRNQGTIINVVSTAGLEGKVTESVYCASKFGVRGFTESLFLELANTNIHIFGAYMGGMKTEFWNGIYEDEQIKHLMDPNDVADIIIDNTLNRKNLTVEQVVIKNKI